MEPTSALGDLETKNPPLVERRALWLSVARILGGAG